jgi:hypothetical protein
MALSTLYYDQKMYQKAYIASIQQVSIAKQKHHHNQPETNQTLGYAYLFKALCEFTFWKARCDGIRLVEDFDDIESEYNKEYFAKKAAKSKEKAKALLGQEEYEKMTQGSFEQLPDLQ